MMPTRDKCTGMRRRIKNEATLLAKIGLAILVTNCSSFCTVAMEKHISRYTNEKAAVINALSAIPLLYDPGFNVGHRVFYGEKAYLQTATERTGKESIFHAIQTGRCTTVLD